MIGKNIAVIRKQRGYTLTQLSELSNISKSYLSNIERNINKNPSLEVIQKIASVLDVDLITLLRTGSDLDRYLNVDNEWVEILKELKELGIGKEQLREYKTLLEFIKWRNQQSN
ncbi:XRE family transcriptional regulator [Robertmurraya massiliosenegalensis]|uniref:XRE family transcriptional regulator n=1 Tax=Robertmurraya massiliosenegalensis TaxID=1287657 RepID=UPI0002E34F06|nr:XRE family transcriptional regulator [Robertmurraya massiliosenegalensis]